MIRARYLATLPLAAVLVAVSSTACHGIPEPGLLLDHVQLARVRGNKVCVAPRDEGKECYTLGGDLVHIKGGRAPDDIVPIPEGYCYLDGAVAGCDLGAGLSVFSSGRRQWQIAASADQVCAIDTAGRVDCDSEEAVDHLPARARSLHDSEDGRMCAVLVDEQAWCWTRFGGEVPLPLADGREVGWVEPSVPCVVDGVGDVWCDPPPPYPAGPGPFLVARGAAEVRGSGPDIAVLKVDGHVSITSAYASDPTLERPMPGRWTWAYHGRGMICALNEAGDLLCAATIAAFRAVAIE